MQTGVEAYGLGSFNVIVFSEALAISAHPRVFSVASEGWISSRWEDLPFNGRVRTATWWAVRPFEQVW
jgi:hypothetical protein